MLATKNRPVLETVFFEERHWNRNAACMISEAWVGKVVDVESEHGHGKILAGTAAEVIEIADAEGYVVPVALRKQHGTAK